MTQIKTAFRYYGYVSFAAKFEIGTLLPDPFDSVTMDCCSRITFVFNLAHITTRLTVTFQIETEINGRFSYTELLKIHTYYDNSLSTREENS